MTTIQRPDPHHSSHRHVLDSGRRPSLEVVRDGVVAGYIHDISTRHGGSRRVSGRDRR